MLKGRARAPEGKARDLGWSKAIGLVPEWVGKKLEEPKGRSCDKGQGQSQPGPRRRQGSSWGRAEVPIGSPRKEGKEGRSACGGGDS